jgi:hypothetical protein
MVECGFMDGVLKDIIFNWMEDNRVTKVVATFNGEGDSGSFDQGVTLSFDHDGEDYGVRYNNLYKLVSTTKINPTPPGVKGDVTIQEYVIHVSEEIESNTQHGMDWWNNDGGCGEVEWILDGVGNDGNHYKRGICLTVSERVTQYNTNHFTIQGEVDAEEDAE